MNSKSENIQSSAASTNAVAASTPEVRAYQAGDCRAVLGLFETVFAQARSEAHWNWKFRDNPFGPVVVSNAWNARGELIGHYGAIPTPLLLGGKRVVAMQAVDTMLHPEARGSGVFQKLGECCYQTAAQAGVVAVYGFPNRAAMPGRIKRLGWKTVAPMQRWNFRLCLPASVAALVPVAGLRGVLFALYRGVVHTWLSLQRWWLGRKAPRCETTIATSVPADMDQLWLAIAERPTPAPLVSVWKDRAYLQWRYGDHPEKKYSFYLVRESGALVALCVVLWTDGAGQIAELLAKRNCAEYAQWAVNRVLSEAVDRKCSWVGFRGHDQGFFARALRGFARRTSADDILCGRVLGTAGAIGSTIPDENEFLDARGWSISAGDSDGI